MHETRKKLKEATIQYEEKIVTLEEQRAYLLNFLTLYKNKKISLDKQITNLFETRKQLKQRVAVMIEKINRLHESGEINDIEAYERFMETDDKREDRPNRFSWPVLPVEVIENFHGDTITFVDQEETFA
jgi:chromosome segregation ATPase